MFPNNIFLFFCFFWAAKTVEVCKNLSAMLVRFYELPASLLFLHDNHRSLTLLLLPWSYMKRPGQKNNSPLGTNHIDQFPKTSRLGCRPQVKQKQVKATLSGAAHWLHECSSLLHV